VYTAGVAYGDIMRRKGVLAPRKPFTPGYDVVGIIDAVGRKTDTHWIGTRVAAFMEGPGFGGYTDYVCISPERIIPVHPHLDDANAVALGLNYITVYQLLHRFIPVKSGQTLLIHGAAGGVGTALIDLALVQGIQCFRTASEAKHAFLVERHCTPMDYRSTDFVERILAWTDEGVDAVIDGIGGHHLIRSYRALRPHDTLVMLGISGDVSKGLGARLNAAKNYLALKLKWDSKIITVYAVTSSPSASIQE
jgi:NADPH:quinone reductase-like Zn-dependent oxidoreductase